MTTKNGAKTISLIPGCIYYQYGPLFNFTNKTINFARIKPENSEIYQSINIKSRELSNHQWQSSINDKVQIAHHSKYWRPVNHNNGVHYRIIIQKIKNSIYSPYTEKKSVSHKMLNFFVISFKFLLAFDVVPLSISNKLDISLKSSNTDVKVLMYNFLTIAGE